MVFNRMNVITGPNVAKGPGRTSDCSIPGYSVPGLKTIGGQASALLQVRISARQKNRLLVHSETTHIYPYENAIVSEDTGQSRRLLSSPP